MEGPVGHQGLVQGGSAQVGGDAAGEPCHLTEWVLGGEPDGIGDPASGDPQCRQGFIDLGVVAVVGVVWVPDIREALDGLDEVGAQDQCIGGSCTEREAQYRRDGHQTFGLPGGLVGLVACGDRNDACLLYTSPSPRDKRQSRMPSSA